ASRKKQSRITHLSIIDHKSRSFSGGRHSRYAEKTLDAGVVPKYSYLANFTSNAEEPFFRYKKTLPDNYFRQRLKIYVTLINCPIDIPEGISAPLHSWWRL
ncbi:MAG: hypothetical protein WCS25_07260, partial [Victivallaceae bacterium]